MMSFCQKSRILATVPIYTATIITSIIFFVSIPSQGQDAQVPSNSNNAATISGLVDRIDALEQEKKDRSIWL